MDEKTLIATQHSAFMLNDQIINHLKCSSCSAHFYPKRFHVCCKGHSSCLSCFSRSSTCKICNHRMKYQKYQVLEIIMSMLQYKCSYDCGRYYTLETLQSHEARCEKRSQKCLFGHCLWKGVADEFRSHVLQYHPPVDINVKRAIEQKWSDEMVSHVKWNNINILIRSKFVNNQACMTFNCMNMDAPIDTLKTTLTISLISSFAQLVNYEPDTFEVKLYPFSYFEFNTAESIKISKLTFELANKVPNITWSLNIKPRTTEGKNCLPIGHNEHYDLLCCPICKQYMKSPVFTCARGHVICGDCYKKNCKCTTCPDGLHLYYIYGNGISLNSYIARPCLNSEFGCGVKLRISDINKHAETCTFKQQTCPVTCSNTLTSKNPQRCVWKGPKKEFIKHLSKHDHLQVNLILFWPFSREGNTTVTRSSFIYSSYFLQTYIIDENYFKMVVQLVPENKNDQSFYYTFELFNEERYLQMGEVCTSYKTSVSSLMNDNQCVVIPRKLFNSYFQGGILRYKVSIRRKNITESLK